MDVEIISVKEWMAIKGGKTAVQSWKNGEFEKEA